MNIFIFLEWEDLLKDDIKLKSHKEKLIKVTTKWKLPLELKYKKIINTERKQKVYLLWQNNKHLTSQRILKKSTEKSKLNRK